jgi:predicted enzyme related to lactoylglutathione lyase
MFRDSPAFASFSVDDTEKARTFYGQKLGLDVRDGQQPGIIELHLGDGAQVMVYPKGNDHKPATFTVLNFAVKDIDRAVDDLNRVGIEMERYDMGGGTGDAKGIQRDERGPAIAWFKDPAGNILSVLETSRRN